MMWTFFDLNIQILKLSGLWVPNCENRSYKAAILYNSFWVSYSMVYFTLAELIALKESAANLTDLIQNLNMLLSFILTLVKVLIWFWYRKDILEIIEILEERRNIFEGDNLGSDDVIGKEKRFKDTWTKSFFVVSSLVPLSAGIISITETITSGMKYVEFSTYDGYVYAQKLPYYSWIPFDHTSSKLFYVIAVTSQCFALLNCGYITVGLDMMFVALISLVTAHLTLTKRAFRRIRSTCTRRLRKQINNFRNKREVLMVECDREIKKCVEHLQVLIRICCKLEIIYSLLVLMQVLISLLVLCTCLYLVSSIPMGIGFLGNEVAYLLAIEIQVAVYCYVGDKLTHCASKIPTAVYESDWIQTSSNFKKTMLITTMRMQKPICITIGKFSPLSLGTFVMIGKTSYSIFTMLKSRN